MSTRLHLIRHGCTASNLARRYMGRSEEALTSEGRWQARQVALRLARIPVAAVYVSPLRRTRETAEIVARPHRLVPEVDAAFNELDLSRWEGLTAAEVEARDPDAWRIWCRDPGRLALAGIESFAEIGRRVRAGLERLVRRHAGEQVAVVTHDGIIRIAVLEALGMSSDHYRSLPVANTGLSVLDFDAERNYLRAHNDTGHLDEMPEVHGPADR